MGQKISEGFISGSAVGYAKSYLTFPKTIDNKQVPWVTTSLKQNIRFSPQTVPYSMSKASHNKTSPDWQDLGINDIYIYVHI